MEGDISNTSDIRSKSAGVIPRSVHTIFDEIQQQSLDAVVKCSFMEIYNEDLSDLLAAIENGSTSGGKPSLPSSSSNSTDDSQELRLMADPEKGVVVQGLEEIVVTDTIPVAAGRPANVRVLPCAELLTDSIRRIFVDDSVSEVFGGENQLF